MELNEVKNIQFPVDIGRYSNSQLLIGLTAFLIGFLIVIQIKGQANVSHQLRSQTEEDLGSIIRELTVETDALQRDVSASTVQLMKYSQAEENSASVVAASEDNLKKLEVVVGSTPVRGPGIIMTIRDANNVMTGYDLMDLVQELRAAGAEAISVNGIRVVNRTSFEKSKGSLYVNHKEVSSPYRIRAISDPKTLSGAVTLLGGIRDTLNSFEGISIKIEESTNIYIEARPQIAPFVYAERYEQKKD